MGSCATTDSGGFVYVTSEIYPECADLALTDVTYIQDLTYWARLDQLIAPGSADSYLLMTAILGLYIIAFGAKQVARLILNR